METIKSPRCPISKDGKHNVDDAREIENPAYKVCRDCGAKFYLIHETVVAELGAITKEREIK